MKHLIIVILIGLYSIPSCGQVKIGDEQKCECIDYRFSRKGFSPIAHSYIGERIVAFCGYQNEYSDGEKIGILSKEASFIGCGYEIILCSESRSIYSLGEAYSDSVKLYDGRFEIYRIELFPDQSGNGYQPIPLFKIEFAESAGEIISDSTIAIPRHYLSESYLSRLKTHVDLAKTDTENPTKYPDLNIHYLFLKAISNDRFVLEFLNAGPYDGYLAEIHSRFQDYLKIEIE